jgi:putative N6-adenine-specific DNA methylase
MRRRFCCHIFVWNRTTYFSRPASPFDAPITMVVSSKMARGLVISCRQWFYPSSSSLLIQKQRRFAHSKNEWKPRRSANERQGPFDPKYRPPTFINNATDSKAKKNRWTNIEGSRQFKRQLAQSQGLPLQQQTSTTSEHLNYRSHSSLQQQQYKSPRPPNSTPYRRNNNDSSNRQTPTKHFTPKKNPQSSAPSRSPLSIQQERREYPPELLQAYIACHAGLQSLLYAELDHLGLPYMPQGFGATLLSPLTVDDLLTCHLYLGTAASVLLRCGPSFEARALGELKRKTADMPWRQMLPQRTSGPPRLQVKVTSTKSRLLHTTAIRDNILKGIYSALGMPDAFLHVSNTDSSVPGVTGGHDATAAETTRVSVQLYRDNVQISLDTAETPIHQRQYRLETGKAPLREDLAYAFLFSAGWKPLYDWTPRQGHFVPAAPQYTALLDPFCGSGTIPIEAAAMVAGLPPGRLRPAPLRGTCLYDPARWDALVHKARHHATSSPGEFVIAASDRDAGAVRCAEANAQRAGVLLDAQHCAFTKHPWWEQPPGPLLLAANLPFGRRISPLRTAPPNYAKHPLLPLYQSLGNHVNEHLEHGRSIGAIFLTDDRELLRHGGFDRPFTTAMATTHGGIPVLGMSLPSVPEVSSDTKDTKEASEAAA